MRAGKEKKEPVKCLKKMSYLLYVTSWLVTFLSFDKLSLILELAKQLKHVKNLDKFWNTNNFPAELEIET